MEKCNGCGDCVEHCPSGSCASDYDQGEQGTRRRPYSAPSPDHHPNVFAIDKLPERSPCRARLPRGVSMHMPSWRWHPKRNGPRPTASSCRRCLFPALWGGSFATHCEGVQQEGHRGARLRRSE
ncbi:MAG: hypothetical protein MZU91_13085 [Desulfosudis oleivorans]|nr:hypothetical protein [Desulfosudis oleivorans]